MSTYEPSLCLTRSSARTARSGWLNISSSASLAATRQSGARKPASDRATTSSSSQPVRRLPPEPRKRTVPSRSSTRNTSDPPSISFWRYRSRRPGERSASQACPGTEGLGCGVISPRSVAIDTRRASFLPPGSRRPENSSALRRHAAWPGPGLPPCPHQPRGLHVDVAPARRDTGLVGTRLVGASDTESMRRARSASWQADLSRAPVQSRRRLSRAEEYLPPGRGPWLGRNHGAARLVRTASRHR